MNTALLLRKRTKKTPYGIINHGPIMDYLQSNGYLQESRRYSSTTFELIYEFKNLTGHVLQFTYSEIKHNPLLFSDNGRLYLDN